MFDVDTLFVVSTRRGSYPVQDIASAVAWSSPNNSHYTLIVDENQSDTPLLQDVAENVQLFSSNHSLDTPSGFSRAAAIHWAIDNGVTYRQVISLSDTCLVLTQELGSFFLPHLNKDGLGVIGVQSRRPQIKQWREARSLLFNWKISLEGWENPPISLCDDILVMTPRFLSPLYQRKLINPDGCEKWPSDYGTYISWVCHMLGFFVVSWGYEDKPLPPLYVNHCHGQYLPPPQMLSQGFLLFSPANRVMSYSEADLRELYKRQRGEPARELPRFGPVATGPEQRDAQQPNPEKPAT